MSAFSSQTAIDLLRAAGRDRSTLEDEVVSLFDCFRTPLLRYLLAFRVPLSDAEEIVQDVFLLLFQHLRHDRSRENLQGWIFSVAHKRALKYHARNKRHGERFESLPPFGDGQQDRAPGPEEQMYFNQQRERLLSIFRALPEQDRLCLSLRAEGLRYREIAGVLGISLGSVANSMARAIERLTGGAV